MKLKKKGQQLLTLNLMDSEDFYYMTEANINIELNNSDNAKKKTNDRKKLQKINKYSFQKGDVIFDSDEKSLHTALQHS